MFGNVPLIITTIYITHYFHCTLYIFHAETHSVTQVFGIRYLVFEVGNGMWKQKDNSANIYRAQLLKWKLRGTKIKAKAKTTTKTKTEREESIRALLSYLHTQRSTLNPFPSFSR